MSDARYEIVTARQPSGHSFTFKVRATGRVYRLAAERYPPQPRFWCLALRRCARDGSFDENDPCWVTSDMLEREALAATIAAARADIDAWIASNGGDVVARWLDEPAPAAAVPAAPGVAGAQPRSS